MKGIRSTWKLQYGDLGLGQGAQQEVHLEVCGFFSDPNFALKKSAPGLMWENRVLIVFTE